MTTNKLLKDVPEYEIIDFDGYIRWTVGSDGRYAVDPLYLEEFKEDMGIKESVSSLVAMR